MNQEMLIVPRRGWQKLPSASLVPATARALNSIAQTQYQYQQFCQLFRNSAKLYIERRPLPRALLDMSTNSHFTGPGTGKRKSRPVGAGLPRGPRLGRIAKAFGYWAGRELQTAYFPASPFRSQVLSLEVLRTEDFCDILYLSEWCADLQVLKKVYGG